MNFVDLVIYTGIFVFACTGALKAREHNMDIFGAIVLAFATAYGGGSLRDILIGTKVNWMNDYFALFLVLSAVVIVFLLRNAGNKFSKTLFYTDAIGLGMFTIGGIERSLEHGINSGFSILLGVMTATFGGLIADIISNRIPALLKKGELYATVCAIGGIVYVALHRFKFNNDLSMLVCVAIVVALRILSKRKQLSLPGI